MNQVFIWGTGMMAKQLYEEKIFGECEILGFIDTYKSEESFGEYPVIRPDEISNKYDYIIITVFQPSEIIEQCKRMGLDARKLIVVFNYLWKHLQYIDQDDAIIKKKMPSLYKKIMEIKGCAASPKAEIYTCYYDVKDEERLIGTSLYAGEYYREYIRYRAFELVAKELKKLDNQNWDVAELGVFRGAFSNLINRKFNNKTLYLFDTFEGFDAVEAEKEEKLGNCDEHFIKYFSDNNVDMVINSMPFKDKCVVRKGLFPETAKGLENNQYGFVSLDVDFGDSTLYGLEYFYPRLIEGGYIFVHDYNHCSLMGVKEAIGKYENKYNIMLKKVPLPDSNGSLIITK